MTKKDYIVIARALRNSRPITHSPNGYDSEIHSAVLAHYVQICTNIMKELEQDNSKFRPDKFLDLLKHDEVETVNI